MERDSCQHTYGFITKLIVNIYTELIRGKHYNLPIHASLLKHSQEYRVLAVLRYLFPEKYNTMVTGESPDLQDYNNSIGIEVTIAVREKDMKAANDFSKLRSESNSKKVKKYIDKIELSEHSLVPIQGEKLALCTTGTSNEEKLIFQDSIRKKKEKLQKYRRNFQVLGLAILLPEIPTSDAETHFVDWINEVFQEDTNLFEFVYVISHRFCIYCDVRAKYSHKWMISKEESALLHIIARMTAEGELSLQDQEWK